MFTGIIEATAKILNVDGGRFILERPESFDDLKTGASIAVSGVCLTVVECDERSISFDVIPETFKKSKLGSLKIGDRVNLERAMRADARFDGHVVQGHIEGVGKIENGKLKIENDCVLTIEVPKDLLPFIIPKGSITLDGVALTVTEINDDHVSVALIPETLKRTTLGTLEKGDGVNVETDILVRTLASLLKKEPGHTKKRSKA